MGEAILTRRGRTLPKIISGKYVMYDLKKMVSQITTANADWTIGWRHSLINLYRIDMINNTSATVGSSPSGDYFERAVTSGNGNVVFIDTQDISDKSYRYVYGEGFTEIGDSTRLSYKNVNYDGTISYHRNWSGYLQKWELGVGFTNLDTSGSVGAVSCSSDLSHVFYTKNSTELHKYGMGLIADDFKSYLQATDDGAVFWLTSDNDLKRWKDGTTTVIAQQLSRYYIVSKDGRYIIYTAGSGNCYVYDFDTNEQLQIGDSAYFLRSMGEYKYWNIYDKDGFYCYFFSSDVAAMIFRLGKFR